MNKKTKTTKQLNVHIRSKHEGILYKCDHCDCEAKTKEQVKLHGQTKHDGLM